MLERVIKDLNSEGSPLVEDERVYSGTVEFFTEKNLLLLEASDRQSFGDFKQSCINVFRQETFDKAEAFEKWKKKNQSRDEKEYENDKLTYLDMKFALFYFCRGIEDSEIEFDLERETISSCQKRK